MSKRTVEMVEALYSMNKVNSLFLLIQGMIYSLQVYAPLEGACEI